LEADFGDLVSYCETAIDDIERTVNSVVQMITQFVDEEGNLVWHFVVKIAGQAYHAVLDCIEKIAAACKWLFDQIEVAIDDVIAFLKFLFAWDDVVTTHKVIKNIFTQMMQNGINQLSTYQTQLDNAFSSLQTDVNTWAGIQSFGSTAVNLNTGSNPNVAGVNSAPASLGIHHFQNNFSSAVCTLPSPPDMSTVQQQVNDILNQLIAVTNLSNSVQAINFDNMTAVQFFQALAANFADTAIQLAQDVLDDLFTILIAAADGVMDLLTTSIYIPVLSELYHDISGDSLSLLDVICLVAAIPVTLVYKLASSAAGSETAPFPIGTQFTNALINATNWSEIQAAFAAGPSASDTMLLRADATAPNEQGVKMASFMTSICAFAASIVLVPVMGAQFTRANANLPALTELTVLNGAINMFYVAPDFPGIASDLQTLTPPPAEIANDVLTVLCILKPFVIDTQTQLPGAVSPILDFVINFVWNWPVAQNAISNQDTWNTTYASLINESMANFSFNIGGMLSLPVYVAVQASNNSGQEAAQLTADALFASQLAAQLFYGANMV
ncbi:MAG TPA: hypothetical protein VKH37_06545, partial [Ferruginibacter sp.]|nr:hypothetical protein [Ferruginibacter sp.]